MKICSTIIQREGKFGTHSCRKTAYLFAIWGGGETDAIRSSARHKSITSAQLYEKDALYLYELAKNNPNYIMRPLTQWRPVIIHNFQFARSINDQRIEFSFGLLQITIDIIAKNYIQVLCQAHIESPNYSLMYCLEKASAFKRTVIFCFILEYIQRSTFRMDY